tara:strand:+ start:4369 stop:4620 length:252 start_codon:yes stop_codon:yes gene_type:complete
VEEDRNSFGEGIKTNDERKINMIDPEKETMVSFKVSNQILETIDDIRLVEGQASRSSVFRKLVNSGLKNYYEYLEDQKLVRQQ